MPLIFLNRIYIRGDKKIKYKNNSIFGPLFNIIIINRFMPIYKIPIFYKKEFNRRFQGINNNYKSFQNILDIKNQNLGQIIHLFESVFFFLYSRGRG